MHKSAINITTPDEFKISFKILQALKAQDLFGISDTKVLFISLQKGLPFDAVFALIKNHVTGKDRDVFMEKFLNSQRRLENELEFYGDGILLLVCGLTLEPFVVEPLHPLPELRSGFCCYGKLDQMFLMSLEVPGPSVGVVVIDSNNIKIWNLHSSYTSKPIENNLSPDIKMKEKLLSEKIMDLMSGSDRKVCSILVGVKPKNHWATNLLEEKYAGKCSLHDIHAIDEAISPLELLVRRQPELAGSTKYLKEIEVLDYFFGKDAEDITRGRKKTLVALRRKVSKVFLVAEDNDLVAVVNQNQGETLESIGLKEDYNQQHLHGNLKMVPFLLWLYRHVSTLKGQVILVSGQSMGGVRLKEECEGIGAILASKQFISSSDED